MKNVISSIMNQTRGTVVANRVWRADRFWTRLRGALGRPALTPGEGLYLTPCSGVHTLGMTFPIQVLAIGADGRVRRIIDLKPWRGWFWDPATRGLLELPLGTCQAPASACQPGDQLLLSPPQGW